MGPLLGLLAATLLGAAVPAAPSPSLAPVGELAHGPFLQAVLSPDGKAIAAVPAAAPRTVLLLDALSGRVRRSLRGPSGAILALAFAPDGLSLAAGAHDRSLRVWRTTTGATRWVLAQPDGSPRALAFSPDGAWLATGDERYDLYLRDARTGRRLRSRTQRDRINFGIENLSWRADGRELYGVGDDEQWSRWQMPGFDHRQDEDVWPQGDYVSDGHTLALRLVDGVRVFDLAGGRSRLWPMPRNRQVVLLLMPSHHEALIGQRWLDEVEEVPWSLLDLERGTLRRLGGPPHGAETPLGFANSGLLVCLTLHGSLTQFRYSAVPR